MPLLLRKLLSRFLTLGVTGDDDDAGAAGDDGAAGGPGDDAGAAAAGDDDGAQSAAGGDDTLDDLLDLEDPPEPRQDPKATAAAATARAERAERALADAMSAPRAAPPSAQPGVDPDTARDLELLEQARRAPGATAESVAWAKWQIDTQRTLREGRRDSQQALAEAREIADKTAFDRLETTKPKLFKAYSDRVEKAVVEMRNRGQAVPPRAALLRFFLGDDMVNGKVKPKQAKAAAGADPAPGSRVDRGRTPPARSDVRARGPQSEFAKRRARLENQLI